MLYHLCVEIKFRSFITVTLKDDVFVENISAVFSIIFFSFFNSLLVPLLICGNVISLMCDYSRYTPMFSMGIHIMRIFPKLHPEKFRKQFAKHLRDTYGETSKKKIVRRFLFVSSQKYFWFVFSGLGEQFGDQGDRSSVGRRLMRWIFHGSTRQWWFWWQGVSGRIDVWLRADLSSSWLQSLCSMSVGYWALTNSRISGIHYSWLTINILIYSSLKSLP